MDAMEGSKKPAPNADMVSINVILSRAQVQRLDELSRIHATQNRLGGNRSEMLRRILEDHLGGYADQASNQ